MKDLNLYVLSATLTIVCYLHSPITPIAIAAMFTYFPIERITRERKGGMNSKYVNWLIDRYGRAKIVLLGAALIYVYIADPVVPIDSNPSVLVTVLLPTIYEVLIFQGFLMGYWNHLPLLGIVLNSALYGVLFSLTYPTGAIIIALTHSLLDNLALERIAILRILFTNIFLRLLSNTITVRACLIMFNND